MLFRSAQDDDATLALDRKRLAEVRAARASAAAEYFKVNAAEWESIRALHLPEREVEEAIISLVGKADSVLDAGTGSGRMLELLAPHIRRGVGIDIGPAMLAIARDRLTRAEASNCQVRLGDVYRLPLPDGKPGNGFDIVIFHQILHFLDDPLAALREAVLAARTIGYSTGPSGQHLLKVFERWGIAQAVAPRIVQAPPGVPVGQLIAEGAVEARPRLGYFVKPLTLEEFEQLYDIRPLLDPDSHRDALRLPPLLQCAALYE